MFCRTLRPLLMETMFHHEKPLSTGIDHMVMDDTRGDSLLGECTGLGITEPLPTNFTFEAEEESWSYVTSEEDEERDQDVEPTVVVVRFDSDGEEMDTNPDYSKWYHTLGVYAKTDYEARCIFLERLAGVRDEIQRMFDILAHGVRRDVELNLRGAISNLFGQEDTLLAYIKDLTQDGDVESNPGPGRDTRGNKPKKEWKPRGGSGTRSATSDVAITASVADALDKLKGLEDAVKEIKKDPIVPIKKDDDKLPVYEVDWETKEVLKSRFGFELHDFDMGFGITTLHKFVLVLWACCFSCFIWQSSLLVNVIILILEILGLPLYVWYAHDMCLFLIIASTTSLVLYFLIRRFYWLASEDHSVIERWRLVDTVAYAPLSPIDKDGRADGISMGALKHNNPILATVEVETYDYKAGFFRRTKMMVSLEILAQILVPSNMLLTTTEDVILAKMQQTVRTLNSVNYGRYLAEAGDYVPQQTLIMAFAIYKHMKEQTRHLNFPRGGMSSP